MDKKSRISLACRKIVQGVYVISTRDGDRINAMTAAWVGRASFNPPLVTVAIGRERFTYGMIKRSGIFAVHVLGPDNKDLGKHFGLKTGRKTDKFAGIPYDTKVTGAPILRDCVAWMDCRVVSRCEAGDHDIFIGEVLDGGVLRDEKGIVYDREEFFR